MRVLYFHQYFTTPTFGGGTRSYEMATELIRQGHAVTMVCGESVKLNLPTQKKNISRGNVDAIDVIQIALSYSNKDSLLIRAISFIRFAIQGIQIALKEKYDIIFATSTPLTVGIPGIAAKIFRKKIFIFEVRDLWPELPKALGLKNPLVLEFLDMAEDAAYS